VGGPDGRGGRGWSVVRKRSDGALGRSLRVASIRSAALGGARLAAMAIPVTVNEMLDGQVGLDLERLDRIHLSAYVPNLQVVAR